MAKKILLIVAVLVVAVLGRVGYKVAQASGQFTEVETVQAGTCSTIAVASGPEDLVIDHATGIAYIAATDRRVKNPRPRGSIYMLDLKDPYSLPVEVLGGTPNDFFSHGVSLWRGSDGGLRLFAVNHQQTGETVEIFDVAEDGQLHHAETIRSEVMHSFNDVVAVGPRQFYATNDQRFDGGIGGALEVFLGLPLGDLVYFDGKQAVASLQAKEQQAQPPALASIFHSSVGPKKAPAACGKGEPKVDHDAHRCEAKTRG